jgi:PAS domain S-box-containing protein
VISGQHRSAGENTRLILLGASTVVVFAVNAAGLFSGITTALPHLFYLPIVLAAYWFPRRGIVFALALSLGYLAMVLPFAGGDPGQIVPALSRAIFLVAVGAIISLLTLRLWNQEERYRGIFNYSEAATFVVAPGETGPRIEEANYMGTKLLGFAAKDLAGEPVTRFINDSNAWEEFQARIHRDGAVYGYETSLSRMDGTAVRVLVSGGRLPDGRSILTLVDITALKNAEDALRAANTN